jgi:hypothetical protein
MLRDNRRLFITGLLAAFVVVTQPRINADSSMVGGQSINAGGSIGTFNQVTLSNVSGEYWVFWTGSDWWSGVDEDGLFGCCGYGFHQPQDYGADSSSVLFMQYDGNLVLYDGDSTPLWATNTDGNSGAFLRLQDGGNLVMYSSTNAPLWSLY